LRLCEAGDKVRFLALVGTADNLTAWKDSFGGVPNPKWVLLVSEEKGTLVSSSEKLSESGGEYRSL